MRVCISPFITPRNVTPLPAEPAVVKTAKTFREWLVEWEFTEFSKESEELREWRYYPKDAPLTAEAIARVAPTFLNVDGKAHVDSEKKVFVKAIISKGLLDTVIT